MIPLPSRITSSLSVSESQNKTVFIGCGRNDLKSSSKDQIGYGLVDTFCALEALELSLGIKESQKNDRRSRWESGVGTVGWSKVETDGF